MVKPADEQSAAALVDKHCTARPTSEQRPPKRVIMLGASNVSRAISTVFQTTQAVCGGPVELIAAIGRGRSYGVESSIMGRRLPGISECGLWNALASRPKAPAVALVTDIGNDILYGIPPQQIADWVAQCVDRLLAADASILMTLLPTENLARLSPLRFHIMRRMLFPRNRSSLEEIHFRVLELNDRVRELGEARGVQMIEQRPDWYGFDPIHIQMRRWRSVWKNILGHWPGARPDVSTRCSLRNWIFLSALAPERRVLFGREQTHEQPVARLSDGTTISLY